VFLHFIQDEIQTVSPNCENFPEFLLIVHQTSSYQIAVVSTFYALENVRYTLTHHHHHRPSSSSSSIMVAVSSCTFIL
jgi:hypothetical protein